VPPSGRMAQGGFLLRLDHPPGADRRHKLNVEDNLEEFGPVSDAALQYFRHGGRSSAAGKAIGDRGELGGSAFGTSRWCRPLG